MSERAINKERGRKAKKYEPNIPFAPARYQSPTFIPPAGISWTQKNVGRRRESGNDSDGIGNYAEVL